VVATAEGFEVGEVMPATRLVVAAEGELATVVDLERPLERGDGAAAGADAGVFVPLALRTMRALARRMMRFPIR
jgi:hypothetical protein